MDPVTVRPPPAEPFGPGFRIPPRPPVDPASRPGYNQSTWA